MLLLDFEGYLINEKFIFKEFTIIDILQNNLNHLFLKSPYTESNNEHVNWIYNNIHLIPINYGTTPIKYIYYLLKNKLVLVKGREKSIYIKKIFKNSIVVDIETLGCPKYIDSFSFHCSFEPHNSNNFSHCSFKKVLFYRNWLLKHGQS
jgi:hypothetical protein